MILLQTRTGRVWTSELWSASSVRASTGTWAPTCPGSGLWTWTSGRWSSSGWWRPSATSSPTACGRPTRRDTWNLDQTPAGRKLRVWVKVSWSPEGLFWFILVQTRRQNKRCWTQTRIPGTSCCSLNIIYRLLFFTCFMCKNLNWEMNVVVQEVFKLSI